MDRNDRGSDTKPKYEAPKVLASYAKEELETLIRPEGFFLQSGALVDGGGCGGGS